MDRPGLPGAIQSRHGLSLLGITPAEASGRFRRLSSYFDDEITAAANETGMLRQSATAGRLAGAADVNGGNPTLVGTLMAPAAGFDPMTGGAAGAALGVGRRLLGAATGGAEARAQERVNNQMLTLLGAATPEGQQAALAALRERAAAARGQTLGSFPARALAGGAGQAGATTLAPYLDRRFQPQ